MRNWRRWAVLLVILGAAGYAFWLRLQPLELAVATATRGPAIDAVYATGIVEPSLEVRIAPRVAGRLRALLVDEGAEVRVGEPLARLEDADLRAATAELESRAAYAKSQFERLSELRQSGLISLDALERARADLEAAQAALSRSREQLAFMTLRAPMAGVVIRRDGEIGDLIPVNQVLFYLASLDPPRINADVDEEDLPRLQVGQRALIRADAFPGELFEGEVAEITPRGDPISRSYRVRISLSADTPLVIGMTADVNIIIAERNEVLLIPTSALQVDGTDNFVWLLEGERVVRRAVSVGVRSPERVEIMEGLRDTDVFAIRPPDDLNESVTVRATVASP
ncbi:MAG: efflux RND transporter periplasmic adaptor subunit [Gammaproteobacteria bacterium]|jgi:RND family efflux transporter MFP subunit|nr:efflux RND transporter periplasmic adaptor subunit [Gammaproteobacteria bacterium]